MEFVRIKFHTSNAGIIKVKRTNVVDVLDEGKMRPQDVVQNTRTINNRIYIKAVTVAYLFLLARIFDYWLHQPKIVFELMFC
jgi:hypothetical protein